MGKNRDVDTSRSDQTQQSNPAKSESGDASKHSRMTPVKIGPLRCEDGIDNADLRKLLAIATQTTKSQQ